MDLTVPGGMGGLEAVRRLARFDPSVRVVISSGYTQDPVMLNYRDYGFCAKLSKPYTPEILAEVLAEALGHEPQGPVTTAS